MEKNYRTNKISQPNLCPNPWDLPQSSSSSDTVFSVVPPGLEPLITPEQHPLIAPTNPPGTLLLTTGKQSKESSEQILWKDWLKLGDSSTQKLSEQLTESLGLLYWKQQLTCSPS